MRTKEQIAAYQKAYHDQRRADPKYRADRARACRKCYGDHAEQRRADMRGRWVSQRVQRTARNLINGAVRAGGVVPLPCWTCGGLEVEAHHPVYSLPLDVVWLCKTCHEQLHREHSN